MKSIKFFGTLAFAVLLFSNCKKEEDKVHNQYVFNGITDIETKDLLGEISFTVDQVSGFQEFVTLRAENVPFGVEYIFYPSGGNPDFRTTLTAQLNNNAESGTYPVTLIGSSESATKEYKTNITIPDFSRYYVDGKPAIVKTTFNLKATVATVEARSLTGGKEWMYIGFDASLLKEGKNQYRLDGDTTGNPLSCSVFYFDVFRNIYKIPANPSNQTCIVNKKGDALEVLIPEITMTSGTSAPIKLSSRFINAD